jgi:hypothetical protein
VVWKVFWKVLWKGEWKYARFPQCGKYSRKVTGNMSSFQSTERGLDIPRGKVEPFHTSGKGSEKFTGNVLSLQTAKKGYGKGSANTSTFQSGKG